VGIERTEYDARQAAARELARERGFSALVAWSRGGSTQDHYADVYYLTGFYTHHPSSLTSPGAGGRMATPPWCSLWTGRRHC
jgi:Xaa-Pro dipeptidase